MKILYNKMSQRIGNQTYNILIMHDISLNHMFPKNAIVVSFSKIIYNTKDDMVLIFNNMKIII